MKKQLLLLVSMFLSLAVNAQDAVEIDGIYYRLDINTKTAEVTRQLYHTYSGDVVIPSTVTKDEVDYSVTSIGKEAFSLSTELVSVTIPDHVTNIADHAFDACWSLASVNIPNSVTHIGEYAFAQCTSLRSITIPNSVTSIDNAVFTQCTALESIVVDENNMDYDSRDNCNAIIRKSDNTLISGCKKTIIPNSVTSIGERAFEGCKTLYSIRIPGNVKTIGQSAFWLCNSLLTVVISEGVTSINEFAFNWCESLSNVNLPSSITFIGKSAFGGCNKIGSITISNNVTTIEENAFDGCNGLYKVELNNNAIVSKDYSQSSSIKKFFGEQVHEYILGEDVTSIGENAFAGCFLNSIR